MQLCAKDTYNKIMWDRSTEGYHTQISTHVATRHYRPLQWRWAKLSHQYQLQSLILPMDKISQQSSYGQTSRICPFLNLGWMANTIWQVLLTGGKKGISSHGLSSCLAEWWAVLRKPKDTQTHQRHNHCYNLQAETFNLCLSKKVSDSHCTVWFAFFFPQ